MDDLVHVEYHAGGRARAGRSDRLASALVRRAPGHEAGGAGVLLSGPRSRRRSTDGLQPAFQPISALPVIATLIDGQLQDVEAQHATFLEVRDKPHVLDDATLDRATRLYTAMREDVGLFDEQLNRWRKEHLTESQRQEVARLTGCTRHLRKAIDDILVLVGGLRKGTIDRILEMSDEEAGIAFLAGKLKLPGDR